MIRANYTITFHHIFMITFYAVKSYFEDFIELDFVELSTEAKLLRVWILHED